MASAFAAVKAGILAGIAYTLGIGCFNLLIFAISREQIIGMLSTFPECKGPAAGGPVATPQDCYTTILVVYLPYVLFLIFVLALVFAALYGILFEIIPWRRYTVKAAPIACLLFLALLYTGWTGVPFDTPSRIAIVAFDATATVLYAAILASFYGRYTRVVEFSSQDPDKLKVLKGRTDVTGRKLTLGNNSAHKIRAEPQRNVAFKEWSFSGGITVEDPKSFETIMRVTGDGMLKASSTRAP